MTERPDGSAAPAEQLTALLVRLEQERHAADRIYNQALTAVDAALRRAPDFPHPPPPYDVAKLPEINRAWNILPDGAPAVDRSLKGRVRGFVWRLVGPALETQRLFNAALVDHLNRNVTAHEETAKAATSVIACLKDQVEALVAFEATLVRYFQTFALYVDTKDRSVGGRVAVLNAGLSAVTDDWLKRWESLNIREERFLRQLRGMDDVRQTATIAQQSALALKHDVERLLARGDRAPDPAVSTPAVLPPDLNAFKYLGFEDAFRGSADRIRKRLAAYVPLFEGTSDVLDLGCGRGEFLELLAARGISARGLDLNHAMAEHSRSRGLDVTEADALGYLAGLPDGALGGIFAAQVVEHLDPAYLMKLLETAASKLRPGGRLVLETINAACWLAFFESYIRDITHVRALHPDTLAYLVRASGFHDVEVRFTSPVNDATRLDTMPELPEDADPLVRDLVATFNANVAKLNADLFTYQDYAVIARV